MTLDSFNYFLDKSVFIITIPNYENRFELTKQNLEREGFKKVVKFNGIVGTNIEEVTNAENKLKLYYRTGLTKWTKRFDNINYIISNGLRGKALSQLMLLQKCVDENMPYIFICEDDCILTKQFVKKANKLWNQTPKDFDIIYIGNQHTKSSDSLNNAIVVDNMYIIKGPSQPTHCILVSNSGANKILNLLKKNSLGTGMYYPDYYIIDICYWLLGIDKLIDIYSWCQFDYSDSDYDVWKERSSGLAYQGYIDNYPVTLDNSKVILSNQNNKNNKKIIKVNEYDIIPHFKNIKKVLYGNGIIMVDITKSYLKNRYRYKYICNEFTENDPCIDSKKYCEIELNDLSTINEIKLIYDENIRVILPNNINVKHAYYGFKNNYIDVTDVIKKNITASDNYIHFINNNMYFNNDPYPNNLKQLYLIIDNPMPPIIPISSHIDKTDFYLYFNTDNIIDYQNIIYLFYNIITHKTIFSYVNNIYYYIPDKYSSILENISGIFELSFFKKINIGNVTEDDNEKHVLHHIWLNSNQLDNNLNIIYINLKNINRINSVNYNYNRYLLSWLIDKIEIISNLLLKFDTVGINLIKNKNNFSYLNNSWTSTSKYINTLINLII